MRTKIQSDYWPWTDWRSWVPTTSWGNGSTAFGIWQDKYPERRKKEYFIDIEARVPSTETVRSTLEIIYAVSSIPGSSKLLKRKIKGAIVITEIPHNWMLENEMKESKKKNLFKNIGAKRSRTTKTSPKKKKR